MAKKAVQAKRQGQVSMEEQIQRLRDRMSKQDQKAAETMAADQKQQDIVRLAFKLLPKVNRGAKGGLTKREQAQVLALSKVDQKAADQLKELLLKAHQSVAEE